MIGASLAAYQDGPYTRAARERLIVDYLNNMPLGAMSGVGEINGVLDGLRAWFAMDPERVLAALNEPHATALAELMGIIVNDGRRRSTVDIGRLSFGPGTPYETVLEPSAAKPDAQVMRASVARLLRYVLREVVKNGTGRRLNNSFRDVEGTEIRIGGKTGSGDNRFEAFFRDGTLRSARSVSRTAGFVFYLADSWFGVITASVPGPQSEGYTFTSSLPLAVLKLLAPTLSAAVGEGPAPAGASEPDSD